MYADDAIFCLKSKNIPQLNKAVNRDLEDLNASLKGNRLSLNNVKTQSMLIATKPRHQAIKSAAEKLKLEFLDNEFYVVGKARYLGVQVDNSLD